MGTRATIAIKYQDRVKSVYCHWDGYPQWLGKTLYYYYNTVSKIEEIMALGDVSSLYPNLYPVPGIKHTFIEPQKDVSIFYGRDRGEKDCGCRVYVLPEDGDGFLDNACHDYTYVFDVASNKWYFSEGNSIFRVLTEKECKHPPVKGKSLDFTE